MSTMISLFKLIRVMMGHFQILPSLIQRTICLYIDNIVHGVGATVLLHSLPMPLVHIRYYLF